MSFSDSDDDSIPPPPPPPPPMPPSAAAEEELEIQMTPVLERMDNGGASSTTSKGLPKKKSGSGNMYRPDSRASTTSSNAYGGEQIELNLDEFAASKVYDDAQGYAHIPEDTTNSSGAGSGKKKRILISIAILCILAAIGAALGVTQPWNNNNDNDSDASKEINAPSPADVGPPPPALGPGGWDVLPPTPQDAESQVKEASALTVLKSNLPDESYAAVSDPTVATPQNRALNWLLYDDSFMDPYWEGLSQSPPDEEAELHFMQRYVAMVLYTTTDGLDWDDNTNWETSTNVCTWKGVDCIGEDIEESEDPGSVDSDSSTRYLQEGMDGTIIGLKLSDNELSGYLPADIVALTSLQILEMHKNKISGELPSYLYDMITLKTLFLDDNEIEGKIPPSIGNLVNLEKLTLNGNEMSGDIPVAVGNLVKLTM